MYIRSVKLENIRCFPELEWSLEDRPTRAGWHVILGDNGTGKSTFLRSISIAIIRADAAGALMDLAHYLRNNSYTGSIGIAIERDVKVDDLRDEFQSKDILEAGIHLERTSEDAVMSIDVFELQSEYVNWGFVRRQNKPAWFSAGYGSLRRITGGDPDLDRRIAGDTDVARHFTLLSDAAALTESITWLQSLQFAKLENNGAESQIDDVIDLINQPGFLPNNVRLLKVTSRSVDFKDANGLPSPIEDLGDGYRAILAMR